MGWGAIAGLINPTALIGTGLSGGLQYLGQREANQTNRDIARETTGANMAEAQRNREFQREMSNSAFQRQMEDMRRAGLNPLLASGMSGASTPSGSAGSAVGATVQNEMEGIPESIQAGIALHNQQLASAKQGAEIGLMKDQQALTKAQAGKAYMETKAISKELPKADLVNSVYDWTKNKWKEATQTVNEAFDPKLKPNIQDDRTPYEKARDKENERKKMDTFLRMK